MSAHMNFSIYENILLVVFTEMGMTEEIKMISRETKYRAGKKIQICINTCKVSHTKAFRIQERIFTFSFFLK